MTHEKPLKAKCNIGIARGYVHVQEKKKWTAAYKQYQVVTSMKSCLPVPRFNQIQGACH